MPWSNDFDNDSDFVAKNKQGDDKDRWFPIYAQSEVGVVIGDMSVAIDAGKLIYKNAGSPEDDMDKSARVIQGLFKGKKAKKEDVKKNKAITRIQAVWRGRKERTKYKSTQKVKSSIVQEEEERRQRRIRIIANQRELQLLRSLRPQKVAQYLEFKRNKSARVIQRTYKRHSLRHKTSMLSKARKNIMNFQIARGEMNVYMVTLILYPLILTNNP